ncbi:MAG: SDR family oxidoreductase [Clostridia bacterium]|nr:SDR family oxidoreductase [Clostridia bacterium]
MGKTELLNELFSLENKVGIVTGGSKGIGYEISKVLAEAGATVYSFSRQLPCKDKDQPIHNVNYIQTDVCHYDQTQDSIDEIIKKEGQLDFLVNNAGITIKNPAGDFSMNDWESVHKTNVDAVFHLCKTCFPYLKESQTKGRIVNITSMAAHLGFTGVAPYCSSKSAVLGLTKALSVEWAKDNILVNSVAPGWIYTDMTKTVKDDDRIKKILGRMTLHEFGQARDVAGMVLFLLGSASSYITGQDFAVDGGALSYGY